MPRSVLATLHREGRSLGFIYFGGRCGTNQQKAPKFVRSQPNLKQYHLSELPILQVSLGDDCKGLKAFEFRFESFFQVVIIFI